MVSLYKEDHVENLSKKGEHKIKDNNGKLYEECGYLIGKEANRDKLKFDKVCICASSLKVCGLEVRRECLLSFGHWNKILRLARCEDKDMTIRNEWKPDGRKCFITSNPMANPKQES